MADNYVAIAISAEAENQDILIALLQAHCPIEGFMQGENEITAYIKEADYSQGTMEDIQAIAASRATSVKVEDLPYTNYNTLWESNFQPVLIDDFCVIKAAFHTDEFDTKYTINISPKMAFGTGHHATTFMMLQTMQHMDFGGKRVFDFGAGTGILAVMASMLGAESIVANDIQAEAMDNIAEHVLLNDCQAAFTIIHGGIEEVAMEQFDIILANINTVVLSQCPTELWNRTKAGGQLLLSGILKERESDILQYYTDIGFKLHSQKERDGWVCLLMQK